MASKRKAPKRGASRRRQKETKEEQVETRSAGAKEAELPLDEVFSEAISNAEAWEKKLADMKENVEKHAYGPAAAKGIPKNFLKELVKLKKADPVVYKHRLRMLAAGLRVIGAPHRIEVYDAMWDNAVDQAKAEARAHVAAGKSMECKFSEGSEAAEAYAEEWMFQTAKRAPGADKLTDDEIRASLVREDRGSAASNVVPMH